MAWKGKWIQQVLIGLDRSWNENEFKVSLYRNTGVMQEPHNKPKGIATSSPRLRQRRYVGLRIKRIEQPQRGCGGRQRDIEDLGEVHLEM